VPVRAVFLLLVAVQAVHSVEEYVWRLYDALAPARYVSTLLGLDPARGFAIVNVALFAFGLWCYWARVRPGRRAWRALAWFWAVLEIANGLGHGALALAAGGYFPGLATAPALLAVGAWLAFRLAKDA
jgi:hypothetical protein